MSGRAFLGLIRHIKDARPTALQSVVDHAGEPLRGVFAERILTTRWYPYPAFVAFLHAVEERLGRGQRDYCRALGAAAGVRDLGTIFRIYRALASPERLIRSCSKVWPSYYRNAGRMDAIAWAPEETILRITEFPQMDRMHCRLMEGWMISTMNDIGVKILPGARESECASRGGSCHEFRCSWQ